MNIVGSKNKKKDLMWEHILTTINFDPQKKIQYITANQIKNAENSWNGEGELKDWPRKLCKQDSDKSRPNIFKENGICIISVKNGTYALIKENIYINLLPYYGAEKLIKNQCDSLVLRLGNSETSMLDNLRYNGIFKEIIGEKIKYGPLLGGRHRCSFKTQLGSETININGSQYETDACYETEHYICIIEAKNIECDSFNIRQLYYPFRTVYEKIKNKKKIIALFIYKNKKGTIHIYKYKWDDPKKMLSITCIGYFRYIFNY